MVSDASIKPFAQTLKRAGLKLERGHTTALQINVGLICNQRCKHCHLDAGPGRTEIMGGGTMAEVLAFARQVGFASIDVTGGAPEMVPGIEGFMAALAALTPKLLFRSNLSALNRPAKAGLMDILKEKGATLVASLPAINAGQTDSQRGDGIFKESIAALKKLNQLGYGRPGTGLELDLVANPTGAFLPTPQDQAENRFRTILAQRYDIVFNNLFVFANVPLGRFRNWLTASGNFDFYMQKLSEGFNPCAIEGLMCRSQVSVAWDGTLFDCDFNLAAGLPLSGHKIHVSQLTAPPEEGRPIMVSDYCYTCTAGAGFT